MCKECQEYMLHITVIKKNYWEISLHIHMPHTHTHTHTQTPSPPSVADSKAVSLERWCLLLLMCQRLAYPCSHWTVDKWPAVEWLAPLMPTCWRTWVPSLGQEDPLEKEMTTYSSILAWLIPWTKDWRATIHGIAKSQTRLPANTFFLLWFFDSGFHEKLKTPNPYSSNFASGKREEVWGQ